jgi:hypothetical protein
LIEDLLIGGTLHALRHKASADCLRFAIPAEAIWRLEGSEAPRFGGLVGARWKGRKEKEGKGRKRKGKEGEGRRRKEKEESKGYEKEGKGRKRPSDTNSLPKKQPNPLRTKA